MKFTFPACNDQNVEQLQEAVNQLHKKIGEKIRTKF